MKEKLNYIGIELKSYSFKSVKQLLLNSLIYSIFLTELTN